MPMANSRPSPLRHVLTMTGHFLGHVAAVVLGLVLIIVGMAMGVTMVLLPVGVVIGLLTPAGASGKPRIVLVHSVRMLGQLLSDGYTAIVIDLNNHKDRSIREVKRASN